MPRPGQKKQRRFVGQPQDPLALTPLLTTYLDRLELKNFSKWTIRGREHNLNFFLAWCEERGVLRAADVTRAIVLQYQRAVFNYRTKKGEPLSFCTQHTRMTAVMDFFRWLTRENLIPFNPATEIDLPRVPKRLPKYVLSAEEVDLVMNQPDVTDAVGVRDRAILEVFYSTGLRRSELMNLKLYDLDLDRGTIVIRLGKGKKDRIVPIGDRAVAWLQKYVTDVRPWFASSMDEGLVFLTHRGEPISRNFLTSMVHDYIEAAGIGKKGACHLFRHACATLMLENGADIRYIQQMLGHGSLETTEIYTHVSIRKLKEVHSLTHPAARLARRGDAGDERKADFTAMHEHVDDALAAVAARSDPRRFHRAARSQALKVLRTAAREKEHEHS